MTQKYVADGFTLLKLDPSLRYRGIDREPFEPMIIETELDNVDATLSKDIWAMYPAGWRRDAYLLFSQNQKFIDDEIVLLKSVEAAQAILPLIPSTMGQYEIIECRIFSAQPETLETPESNNGLLGYDIAYPGGDYYSAVRNGLHVNPHEELVHKYYAHLNEYGLFIDLEKAKSFLEDFRKLVHSEAASNFIIYELISKNLA